MERFCHIAPTVSKAEVAKYFGACPVNSCCALPLIENQPYCFVLLATSQCFCSSVKSVKSETKASHRT